MSAAAAGVGHAARRPECILHLVNKERPAARQEGEIGSTACQKRTDYPPLADYFVLDAKNRADQLRLYRRGRLRTGMVPKQ
jgi:hypothetical protein